MRHASQIRRICPKADYLYFIRRIEIILPLVLFAFACRQSPDSTSAEVRGLRSAVYVVTDLDRAREWYTSVLEHEPYFDEPFYVGFRVGDFELGLDPDTTVAKPGPGGTTVYWEVPLVTTTYDRLLKLGAVPVAKPTDVGGGTIVAVVADPFGNHFGLIELAAQPAAE